MSVMGALIVRPALLRHFQRRGIQVYLFIINEETDFDHCFDTLGVDGVMTDYPTKLEAYLKRRTNFKEDSHLLEEGKTS